MGMKCDVCGKVPQFGNSISRRGKAKYLGGVGQKVTGITRRKFKPNLQRIRAVVDGKVCRLNVCTACIRSNRVQRPVAVKPFTIRT